MIEYWNTPTKEWAAYVMRVWRGDGRVEEVKGDAPERIAFEKRAREALENRGIKVKRMRTWVNVMVPKTTIGYDDGYPHEHANTDGMTLVHYLEPGDKPAPLDIFDGDEITQIFPERGMTVFMPNGLRHGVHRNNGTTNRIAFLATGYTR